MYRSFSSNVSQSYNQPQITVTECYIGTATADQQANPAPTANIMYEAHYRTANSKTSRLINVSKRETSVNKVRIKKNTEK